MAESLASRDSILRRICGEYLEMPGLRLTRAQAQRLWALDEQTCSLLLDTLTEDRFLYRRNDGTYARLPDGPVGFTQTQTVKAAWLSTSALPHSIVRSRDR